MHRVFLLLVASSFSQGAASGQVLARPGWTGSGVAPEPWWRSAVIYRLDPLRFQDSEGDGVGDLPGVAQRLGYLQALGVDAILLDRLPASEAVTGAGDLSNGDAGLDDLVRSASDYRLRVLLTVSPAWQNGSEPDLLRAVHHWLGLGVAGVWLPEPPLRSGDDAGVAEARYAALLEVLRGVLRSAPGERVLLADPAPGAPTSSSSRRGTGRAEASAVLTTAALLPVDPPDALALRSSLLALSASEAPGRVPLLRFAGRPHTGSPDAVAEAALLLGSRGAVLLDFGDELGLDTSAAGPGTPSGQLPVMQWTPANVDRPAPAPIERRPAAPETQYGPYRPYIHPPPTVLTGPAPAAPRASVDGDIPAAPPDPNTLPGFTAGKLPVPPTDGERLNVATEERDPHSPLAAFRQMVALHHGDAAVRSGTELVLPVTEANTVVWVRRRPAGSVTGADVLGAVNVGDGAVTLNLDTVLSRAGERPGSLRALFSYAAAPLTGESTSSLRLPPHSVYLGEWARGGPRR